MTRSEQPRYSLADIAALAGVSPRTVRYYIAQGLLPAASSAGPGPKYGDVHLARLRLIRKLQRDHQPLAAIRRQIGRFDDETILQLGSSPVTDHVPADGALDYIRRLLSDPGHARPTVEAAPSMAVPPPRMPAAQSAPVSPSSAKRAAPAAPAASSAAPAPATPSSAAENAPIPAPVDHEPAPELTRSQWERIVLAPDVELHVRRPLTRIQSKRVDRLVTIGRELLEEDPT